MPELALDNEKCEELLVQLRDVRSRVDGNLYVLVGQSKELIDEWIEKDQYPGQRSFTYAVERYNKWDTLGVNCLYSSTSNNSLGLGWWPNFPLYGDNKDLIPECAIREGRLKEIDKWGVMIGTPLDVFTSKISLALSGEELIELDSILKYT